MASKRRWLVGYVIFTMPKALTTCGILLLMAGLSVAQETPQQYEQRVRPHRFPPGTPMSEDQPIAAQPPNQNGFQPGPRVIPPPGAQPNQNVFGNTVQPLVSQPNVSQPNVSQPNISQPNVSRTIPGLAQASMPAQAPAASQMPSDLAPPTPPQVTYRDGMLTVQALNSTLGSVLNAIRNKAGIQFEGLDAAPERVVVSMGPAPEGVVLAAILSGSRFDYIAIDRSDSPGIVQRVVLMPRAGGAAASTVASEPAAGASADNDEEAADDDPDNLRATPQDTPARPPVMQAQPIPQQPNPQPHGDPVTKTPEQLLEEIKALQQRQQQSQQQTPPQKIPQ